MEEETQKINLLKARLDEMALKQQQLTKEMASLYREIQQLKADSSKPREPEVKASQKMQPPPIPGSQKRKPETGTTEIKTGPQKHPKIKAGPSQSTDSPSAIQGINKNLEEYIGGNLISKIGVGAIVIGMGIGLKYAIDNDLISPLMRVIIGYLIGAVLLFFSYRLRKAYKIFGAVLFSGAMALMFFTTYAAHSYFSLLPQGLSFGIMVALTAYTVGEALRFNLPVIAHMGLVGAYAVPFLLGDNPDAIVFLFTYTAIVNLGILYIAFLRYWKSLYYAAFSITWLIYYSWYEFSYQASAHFGGALFFLVLFFVVFYLAFLAYKLVQREKYDLSDVVMLLLNSFIFYGIGYTILQDHELGQHQLGLFTLINALIHLGVSSLVWSYRLADRNLFYLVSGVGLIFTILAIPVQLDGNWVTLLWAGEAALLFWIGRTRKAPIYEYLGYLLFILSFSSLVHDLDVAGFEDARAMPLVLNINMLTTLFTAGFLGFSMEVNRKTEKHHPLQEESLERQFLDYGLPILFLLSLYLGFLVEINNYFDQLKTRYPGNDEIDRFQIIWQVNYTMFFVSVLSLVNLVWLRNQGLARMGLALKLLFLALFLYVGVSEFDALNEVYLSEAVNRGGAFWYVMIRYVSYLFVGGLLGIAFLNIRSSFIGTNLRLLYDIVFHITLLLIISGELFWWMKTLDAEHSFQAGLSIFWGIYTLMLITLGIGRSQKHLRIMAIVLIGVTLCKVAVVDLADLDTLTKTLVLVILGGLLLVVSFLYNKFREKLFKA